MKYKTPSDVLPLTATFNQKTPQTWKRLHPFILLYHTNTSFCAFVSKTYPPILDNSKGNLYRETGMKPGIKKVRKSKGKKTCRDDYPDVQNNQMYNGRLFLYGKLSGCKFHQAAYFNRAEVQIDLIIWVNSANCPDRVINLDFTTQPRHNFVSVLFFLNESPFSPSFHPLPPLSLIVFPGLHC